MDEKFDSRNESSVYTEDDANNEPSCNMTAMDSARYPKQVSHVGGDERVVEKIVGHEVIDGKHCNEYTGTGTVPRTMSSSLPIPSHPILRSDIGD